MENFNQKRVAHLVANSHLEEAIRHIIEISSSDENSPIFIDATVLSMQIKSVELALKREYITWPEAYKIKSKIASDILSLIKN